MQCLCPRCNTMVTGSFYNLPGKPTIWAQCGNCFLGARHIYCYLEEDKHLVSESDQKANYISCMKDLITLLRYDWFREDMYWHSKLGSEWIEADSSISRESCQKFRIRAACATIIAELRIMSTVSPQVHPPHHLDKFSSTPAQTKAKGCLTRQPRKTLSLVCALQHAKFLPPAENERSFLSTSVIYCRERTNLNLH